MNTTRLALAFCLLLAAEAPALQPTPADEWMATARSNPALAYRQLGTLAASRLPDSTRQAIAREALRALAAQVETGAPYDALFALWRARDEAAGLPAPIAGPVKRLHAMAHRRALVAALEGPLAQVKDGKWAAAAAAAELWSVRLFGRDEGAPGLNKAAREACDGLAKAARALATAQSLRAAIDDRPSARSWSRRSGVGLSEKLNQQLDTLQQIAHAYDLSRRTSLLASDKRELSEALKKLRALGHVGFVEEACTGLAVKALLEGRMADFEVLLPRKVPADKARAALRDLKALTLGEGKVSTWAGKAVAPTGAFPRPPSGVAPLVTAERYRTWRPPAKDTAPDNGPPALAEALFQKILKEAAAQLKAEHAKLEEGAAEARKRAAAVLADVQKAEAAERKPLAAIEYGLGRRLRPEERPTALYLLGKSAKPGRVAEALREQDGGETAFLDEVKRLLRRPLTSAQVAEARRLRKQGRRASEVAELLGG